MDGETGDLVFEVNGLGAGRLLVELEAAALEIGDGAGQRVGADGDVAVLSQILLFHDLNGPAAAEDAAVALGNVEAEHQLEQLGGLHGFLGVLGVDADVLDLEAQHGVDGLARQTLDLVPVFGLDEVLLHHPGAAAGNDLVKGQVVQQVFGVDAARGHPAQVCVRAGHGFQLGDAAVLFGREEFHNVQAHAHGLLHLARSSGAGHHQHALVDDIFGDLGVKARADDELDAGGDGSVRLLLRQHGARAHQHFRYFGHDALDGLLGRCGAERDLGRGQAAFDQGLCQRHSLVCVVDGDDGHDADVVDFLNHVVHSNLLLLFPVGVCSILWNAVPLSFWLHYKRTGFIVNAILAFFAQKRIFLASKRGRGLALWRKTSYNTDGKPFRIVERNKEKGVLLWKTATAACRAWHASSH